MVIRSPAQKEWRTVRCAHVCIPLTNTGGEPHLLLIQDVKPDIRPYPLWRIPGGTIQEGETPKNALEREFREETGLSLPIGPVTFRNTRGKMARKTKALLTTVISTDFLPINKGFATEEVLSVRYFPLSILPLSGNEAEAEGASMDMFNFRLLAEAVRTNWRLLEFHGIAEYLKPLMTPP